MEPYLLISLVAGAAIVGAALVYLVASRRGSSPRPAPAHPGRIAADDRGPSDGRPMHWTGDGRYAVALVGEARYQNAIADNVRELHGIRGSSIDCTAELVVESHNRQDPGAISVRIKNRTVGYLKSDEATVFRRRLVQSGRGGQTTTCGARIVGGAVGRGGERAPYSVRLDLRPFD